MKSKQLIKLKCKKDWVLDGVTHFKKGEIYEGEWKENNIRLGFHTFYVSGGKGLIADSFHSGSDYFDIPFGEESL